MKDEELYTVDKDVINEKAFKIGNLLNGMRIPDVLGVLGMVLIEIVLNADRQGYDIRDVFVRWLKMMAKNIATMDSEHFGDGNDVN
jgi:hypothetical protein